MLVADEVGAVSLPPKDYAEGGDGINGNHGTAQQVKVGDQTPTWVFILAIVLSVIASVLTAWTVAELTSVRRDLAELEQRTGASDAVIRQDLSELSARAGDIKARADTGYELAQKAEREGRLAEEAAMHLRSTMRAYGISVNPQGVMAGIQDDLSQEEPIEP